MNFSYIKLDAKKRLVRNQCKSFLISFVPYVTIILLTVLNYYLYIFLKNADFTSMAYISLYSVYVKATLFALSVSVSFVLWRIVSLYSDKYFFCKNMKTHIKLEFRQYITAITVSILKFFLSIAWGTALLLPCAVMIATLYFSIRSGDYTFNVMLTLFVASVILFVIGTSFLFVILKRYSMCNFVIFTKTETNSLKVIEESIEIIEGNTVRFSLYNLSFIGWILSCVIVIPVFYVLPYVKMAKYSFYKVITKPQEREFEAQKPIVFYFTQKEKA